MDENDPRVKNSQEIPPDKDFDLANENGKLKERIKELEVGLRNGEIIANERVERAKRGVGEHNKNGTKLFASQFAFGVVSLFGIVVLSLFLSGWLRVIENRSPEESKKSGDLLVVSEQGIAGSIAIRDDLECKYEELEKEKVKLAESAEKLKAEAVAAQAKLAAEKAELEKKLNEISASTAAQKAEQLAKQKKVAEEFIRSWCGVPVEVSQKTATTTNTIKESEGGGAPAWAMLISMIVVVTVMSIAYLCGVRM